MYSNELINLGTEGQRPQLHMSSRG
jgi:hypothetical protein